MIVYCQGTYDERVEQTLEAMSRMTNVDRKVVIVDETVTASQKKALASAGCEVYHHPWNDNFPEMRNHYLDKLQGGDWCLVSDPDEWFCEKFNEDIKKITAVGDEKGIRLFLVNSHDTWHEHGKEPVETKSSFYKNLLFKYKKGTRYRGVGEAANVHEALELTATGKEARLNDIYYYEHHKHQHEVWERAMRNVYIGGGGNNAGDRNPQWKRLKATCKALGLEKWNDVRDYMREGNIDGRLAKWLHDNRRAGFDWQNEMVDAWRWYFKYLHPEENVDGLEPLESSDEQADAMKAVEDIYMKVLGRHADQQGKEYYTTKLASGKMTKRDIENALLASDEYKKKVLRETEKTGDHARLLAMVESALAEALKKLRITVTFDDT